MPPTCQQLDPAEMPVRTTPACQAVRIAVSTPCSRQHIASIPATLPPNTQIESGSSSSARDARSCAAAYKPCRPAGLSPWAVLSNQIRSRVEGGGAAAAGEPAGY